MYASVACFRVSEPSVWLDMWTSSGLDLVGYKSTMLSCFRTTMPFPLQLHTSRLYIYFLHFDSLLLPSSIKPKACCILQLWQNSYPATAREKPANKLYICLVASCIVGESIVAWRLLYVLLIQPRQVTLCCCIFVSNNRGEKATSRWARTWYHNHSTMIEQGMVSSIACSIFWQ